MQAINTKYVGPSNTRGSRYSATAGAGRVIVGCNNALNADGNHMEAAKALAVKFDWAGEMVGGHLPDGSMVWVFTNPVSRRFTI